jgi:uncharacterized protein Smg (DUF494 family)
MNYVRSFEMTWFEVEQIDHYLDWLESQLDQWRLGRHQMKIQNAELLRMIHKAETVYLKERVNPVMRDYLLELQYRSQQCRRMIEERLKLR